MLVTHQIRVSRNSLITAHCRPLAMLLEPFATLGPRGPPCPGSHRTNTTTDMRFAARRGAPGPGKRCTHQKGRQRPRSCGDGRRMGGEKSRALSAGVTRGGAVRRLTLGATGTGNVCVDKVQGTGGDDDGWTDGDWSGLRTGCLAGSRRWSRAADGVLLLARCGEGRVRPPLGVTSITGGTRG